jgi:transcriptional regulator with XRE-family HTH domain
MSEINDRIKQVRKSKGLTMEQFGSRIGLGKSAVNKIEKGINGTTDQTVQSICREFGVSEVWLRTGDGPMLDDTSGSILDRLVAEYHLNDRKRAILTAFLKLSPADQDAILRYVDGVVAEISAQPAAPDLDIDAEVEAYRQELLAQKKAEADASVSAGSANAG